VPAAPVLKYKRKMQLRNQKAETERFLMWKALKREKAARKKLK
jgi:hypothetical protein